MPSLIEPRSGITTPKARRSFIRNNIADELWRTESGASILDSLRNLGLGINTQDFYNIRSQKLEEFERREIFETLHPDQLIPYADMTERDDIHMTMDAQYRLRMTVYNPDIDDTEFVYRSIADDRHYTKREIEGMAEGLFSMGGEGYNFSIENVELEDVWIRPNTRLWR